MSSDITGDQRTDEWFTERLGKATASRFRDIMSTIRTGEAASRKNYRAELVAERLTGVKQDGFTSKEMQHGIDYEASAKIAYWLDTNNEVIDCGFFKHSDLNAGASPDGLVGEDGLIEIKCPNTAKHIETLKTQKLPSEYFWQVMGQMWITNRQWVDYVSFDPRMPANSRLFIKRIERDEEQIQKLINEVTVFLQEVDDEVAFISSYNTVREGNNDERSKTTTRLKESSESTTRSRKVAQESAA